MSEQTSGRSLSRRFYEEAVSPLLGRHYPGLKHSACLIGTGSEVLGYDDETSQDHDWGPRLQLFLQNDDRDRLAGQIKHLLSKELPREFLGYPTSFSEPDEEDRTRALITKAAGPVDHQVLVTTIGAFFRIYLKVNPYEDIRPRTWLTFSEQYLLSAVRARIFHDDLGLSDVLARFRYYPQDVWLYILSAQWQRISQSEAFVGRAGAVGDEFGSRLIAAQIVNDLARLCFLMEKRYAPYAKWFGTAFQELNCATKISPAFKAVLDAGDWHERERHLSEAYRIVALMHNDLGITGPISPEVAPFHQREYLVIHADRFATAIREQVADPEVIRLPEFLGSVDQFSHSTDVLSRPNRRVLLQSLFEAEEASRQS